MYCENYIHLSIDKSNINLEDLTSVLSKDIYTKIYKLIQVALTLPISSSTSEHSLSTIRSKNMVEVINVAKSIQ